MYIIDQCSYLSLPLFAQFFCMSSLLVTFFFVFYSCLHNFGLVGNYAEKEIALSS